MHVLGGDGESRVPSGKGDINHAKSDPAPQGFIRIQLKSMGSFMRQFSPAGSGDCLHALGARVASAQSPRFSHLCLRLGAFSMSAALSQLPAPGCHGGPRPLSAGPSSSGLQLFAGSQETCEKEPGRGRAVEATRSTRPAGLK